MTEKKNKKNYQKIKMNPLLVHTSPHIPLFIILQAVLTMTEYSYPALFKYSVCICVW